MVAPKEYIVSNMQNIQASEKQKMLWEAECTVPTLLQVVRGSSKCPFPSNPTAGDGSELPCAQGRDMGAL